MRETWASCEAVTFVTATGSHRDYLHRIGSMAVRVERWSPEMTKLLALVAAIAVFVPAAFMTLNQAAQMVA